MALIRLHVLSHIPLDFSRSAFDIAREINVNPEYLYRTLRAASSLGILKEEDGEDGLFSHTSASKLLLDPNGLVNILLLEGHPVSYRMWEGFEETIRTGKSKGPEVCGSGTLWDLIKCTPDYMSIFQKAMSAKTISMNPIITKSTNFEPFETVVDIGGSHGRLILDILREYPTIKKGINFDLNHVIKSNQTLDRSNEFNKSVLDRFEEVGGDFFQWVPSSSCFVLKSIIHDWNDTLAKKLLTVISQSLLPNGSHSIEGFTKPPDSSGVLVRLAKRGILMVEGDEWHHQRSIISPPFSSVNIKPMFSVIEMTTDRLIKELVSNNSDSIDIHNYMTRLTFDIIGELSMGYDFGSIQGSNLSNHFNFILDEMMRPIRRLSSWIPLPQDRKLNIVISDLFNIIQKGINSRRNHIKGIDGTENDYKANFLLDHLLENHSNLTDDEIIGNIFTFLLAGHETSANLLTFIFYFLSIHQNIQEDLYKHVIHTSESSLDNITLLDAVINETLRLFPPAPMIGRNSINGDTLPGNIKIPKDTLILISVYAIQRNPEIYENPNEFNPYRWINTDLTLNTSSNFFPFSMGNRICIGQKFSISEAKIIISKLLKNFKLTFDETSGYPFQVYQRATLTPKYPVYLKFEKRI
eukprot:gene2180-2683_t